MQGNVKSGSGMVARAQSPAQIANAVSSLEAQYCMHLALPTTNLRIVVIMKISHTTLAHDYTQHRPTLGIVYLLFHGLSHGDRQPMMQTRSLIQGVPFLNPSAVPNKRLALVC